MPRNNNQFDLDFHASAEDGYDAWQSDQKDALRQVTAEWGLPLGAQVRLRRRGIDGDFEGKLELVSLPPRIDRRLTLELKIGRMTFSSAEVESCSVLG